MNIQERSFIFSYSIDTRIRHFHKSIKNHIIEFTVQLETLIKDRWHPVIRYDTKHGFAHRDIIHPDGTKSKVPLAISDYNEALTMAEKELEAMWEIYRSNYLREVESYERKRILESPEGTWF